MADVPLELLQYIREGRKARLKDADLRAVLLSRGWKRELVEAAFARLNAAAVPEPDGYPKGLLIAACVAAVAALTWWLGLWPLSGVSRAAKPEASTPPASPAPSPVPESRTLDIPSPTPTPSASPEPSPAPLPRPSPSYEPPSAPPARRGRVRPRKTKKPRPPSEDPLPGYE